MNGKWTTVFQSTNLWRAELVKNVLEHHKIPAVLINKQASMYNIGSCEVLVYEENVISASIILEHEVEFE